jgi:hypothetical protein
MIYKIRYMPPGPRLSFAAFGKRIEIEDGNYLQLDVLDTTGLIQTVDYELSEVEDLITEIECWEGGYFDFRKQITSIKKPTSNYTQPFPPMGGE